MFVCLFMYVLRDPPSPTGTSCFAGTWKEGRKVSLSLSLSLSLQAVRLRFETQFPHLSTLRTWKHRIILILINVCGKQHYILLTVTMGVWMSSRRKIPPVPALERWWTRKWSCCWWFSSPLLLLLLLLLLQGLFLRRLPRIPVFQACSALAIRKQTRETSKLHIRLRSDPKCFLMGSLTSDTLQIDSVMAASSWTSKVSYLLTYLLTPVD